MSKNKINEGLIDKAIESIFIALAKNQKKAALQSLAKKDPEVAKLLKNIEDSKTKLKSRLTKKQKKAASQGTYFKPGAFK
tara:strand:- start:32 stop:271 length:240 start_codon:yes stop_codon:yes gene_type:complete